MFCKCPCENILEAYENVWKVVIGYKIAYRLAHLWATAPWFIPAEFRGANSFLQAYYFNIL